jgi:hypothetical protein
MTEGRGQMADDGCEVRSGGCGDGESGQPTPQAPSEDGVACGEWRVASEIGVASGQWSVASESGGSGERQGASGGCGEGEPERSEPTQEKCLASEKAPNEAKLESTQSSLPLEVESSATKPSGRERSQSSEAVASGERQCHVGQAFEPDVSLERLTYPHEKSSSTGPAFPGG